MDPDANLAEQLRLVVRIQAMLDRAASDDPATARRESMALAIAAQRLAELVEALDTWLRGGGFLPAAWRRPT